MSLNFSKCCVEITKYDTVLKREILTLKCQNVLSQLSEIIRTQIKLTFDNGINVWWSVYIDDKSESSANVGSISLLCWSW